MFMKVVFLDGTWLVGRRRWWYVCSETRVTYHFKVLSGSSEALQSLKGKIVAVPIHSVKYFILDALK